MTAASTETRDILGADVQLDLFETAHIRLECPYRVNQKDWKPTFIPLAKARKRIETLFSQLTDQFLTIRNYAKITSGLYARIIAKISALTILQYVNFINNKPIGRIKYALNKFRQRVNATSAIKRNKAKTIAKGLLAQIQLQV